jgi:hypothetical protein
VTNRSIETTAQLPPEHLELVEVIREVPPVSWYPNPVDLLCAVLQHRSPDNVLSDPAFSYLASFLKQQTPTIELLLSISSMSNHYTPERFTEWMRQMSELYYPTKELLKVHAQAPGLRHRELDGKLEDLAENIVRSLSPDAAAYHQKPSGLSPDKEMTIVLACAQFVNIPQVFPHSPLLVPDRYSGYWRRFIDDETADCLLNHGHAPKVVHNVLSAKSYASVDEIIRLLHAEVPAMMSGVL